MGLEAQELLDARRHMKAGDLTQATYLAAVNGHAEPGTQDRVLGHYSSSRDASLLRVLIVEDNNEIRFMMRLLLEERCEVDAVGSFDDAVTRLNDRDYEVAFIDIDLGEHRTGVDLVQRIRGAGQQNGMSLVACTAYAMPGDREKFLEEGFDYYIGKPFTEKDLLDTLDAVRPSA